MLLHVRLDDQRQKRRKQFALHGFPALYAQALESSIVIGFLAGIVKGSQTEFPFVQHSIPISGIDFDEQSNRDLDMEIKRTVALLNRRKFE